MPRIIGPIKLIVYHIDISYIAPNSCSVQNQFTARHIRSKRIIVYLVIYITVPVCTYRLYRMMPTYVFPACPGLSQTMHDLSDPSFGAVNDDFGHS